MLILAAADKAKAPGLLAPCDHQTDVSGLEASLFTVWELIAAI
jgi:hypothetical protein